jgi:hypothetical protein
MSKRFVCDPHKEQRWRRHIQCWHASGLSVRDFCKRHHLSEPSFYHWRRTLHRRDQPATHTADQRVTFVPLHVRAEPATTPVALEVVLANGRRLHVGPGFDPATLRALLVLLEDDAC